jgi:hypothetical protein
MLELGSNRLYGVNKGFDTTTDLALDIAKVSLRWFNHFDAAIVDRFDGLTIFNREHASDPYLEGSVNGLNFRTALCGYGGTGVVTSAVILELFGFGDRMQILHEISVGGDTAHYEFTREHQHTSLA